MPPGPRVTASAEKAFLTAAPAQPLATAPSAWLCWSAWCFPREPPSPSCPWGSSAPGRAEGCALTPAGPETPTSRKAGCTHLRCVRKLPLTCPEPSHPGVGQDMPSVFTDFQENWEPLRYPSFCLLAARGQPEALRWEAYFPVMWPWPSQPGTGHLGADRETCFPAWRHLAGGLTPLLCQAPHRRTR